MEDRERYIVSARKYRPSSFGGVVGQDSLTRTLRNAVSSGRLAQAYLFCGPRGVGKTSCARIFAKRINCLNPTPEGEACGECESCRQIERGASFNIVELDAASNNSVDDIRSLTEQVTVPPQVGKYRVFIIDEVHMLTSAAFNAFLKTLEEPPSYVVFILATTEKHKVIPTILSRCQIYDFRRITIDDMVRHLRYVAGSEGIEAEDSALAVIAQKADGAMRDALSIFDQVSASCGGHVTYEKTIGCLNVLDYGYYFRLTESFRSHDVQGALMVYKEIRDAGFDSLFFVNGLSSHVRDMMVASDSRTLSLLEVGEEIGKRYQELAQSMPLQWYYGAMKVLNDTDLNFRTSGNKQLLVELALIRLCGEGQDLPLGSGGVAPGSSRAVNPSGGSSGGVAAKSGVKGPEGSSPAVPSGRVMPQPRSAMPRPGGGVRVSHPGGTPRSFRLNGNESNSGGQVEENSEPTQPPSVAKRDNPYTAEGVRKAWEGFMESHPKMRLLTGAMRLSGPLDCGPGRIGIGVGNMAQGSTFEHDIPALTEYLREALNNDSITVVLQEVAQAARVKRLTPSDQVKKIVSENPMLRDLLSEMDAELV